MRSRSITVNVPAVSVLPPNQYILREKHHRKTLLEIFHFQNAVFGEIIRFVSVTDFFID